MMDDQEYQIKTYQEMLQSELRSVMRNISEDHFCAGWMSGLATTLWFSMLGTARSDLPTDTYTVNLTVWERSALLKLHEVCGGWFMFDGFVTTDEWLRMLSEGYTD